MNGVTQGRPQFPVISSSAHRTDPAPVPLRPVNRCRVAVIGGAGHVGLGMCLVLANAGHTVDGVDVNEATNATIMAGKMPFIEQHGEDYLKRALTSGHLTMTPDVEVVREADVVIIVLGTPIDENLNPRFSILKRIVDSIEPHLQPGQLIMLRSTVSPGTTARVRKMIEKLRGWQSGRDFDLVYAPERVLQGKCIDELQTLPQIVGAFDDAAFQRARSFFSTYVRNECIQLSPAEAELGKLISNMARYLNFAFANEIYLLVDAWGGNANRIVEAINRDYPRLNIPRPGPNVGGPCLYKDGYFLVERIPFPELVSTAFKINEAMTAQIVMKIERMPAIERVAILGMTFKADNDDIRNSLSYKLKKQLDNGSYEVSCVDPYVQKYADFDVLHGAECLVLMTPHKAFSDLERLARIVDNPDCVVIDIWGFWERMRFSSDNGIFRLGDAMDAREQVDNRPNDDNRFEHSRINHVPAEHEIAESAV